MKAIWSWIKEHWIKSIFIIIGILLALILPPFVVHWMFKTPARNTFFEQTWGPGDLITYLAGFEAFLGTVFLGIVAVRQNDKANELNKRLVDIEEKSSLLARYPNLDFKAQDVKPTNFWDVLDYKYILFCSKETADEYRLNSVSKDNYYLFPIQITNHSSSSVKIELSEMSLVPFSKNHPPEKYEVMPSEFPIKSLFLSSNEDNCFGFLINPLIASINNIYRGTIILSVVNSVSEEYKYIIDFFAGVSTDLKYSELLLSEITHMKIVN
jgi:hypothetical protein